MLLPLPLSLLGAEWLFLLTFNVEEMRKDSLCLFPFGHLCCLGV